jgi:hypothetical protein
MTTLESFELVAWAITPLQNAQLGRAGSVRSCTSTLHRDAIRCSGHVLIALVVDSAVLANETFGRIRQKCSDASSGFLEYYISPQDSENPLNLDCVQFVLSLGARLTFT